MGCFLNAVLADNQRSQPFSAGFWLCHICRSIFFHDFSLNLLMMLWIVDGGISNFLPVLQFHYLSRHSSKRWRTSHHCLWMTWVFQECSICTRSWHCPLLPVNLLSCGMLQLWTFHHFPSRFLALSQRFWSVLQASNWHILCIFHKER